MVPPAVAAIFAALSGCAVKTVQYTDREIEPYLKALTAPVKYPLARTLTWKYYYTVGTGKDTQAWFIADGKLLKSAKEISGVQLYAAQPSTYSAKVAEAYTEHAREATKRGEHEKAQLYHGLAVANLQTQIASERIAAGMALGSAIQGLGAALLDATIINHGTGAAEYVRAPERGVIGGGAAEGTVLELFFRAARRDGNDAKPGNLSMRWETLVTFKDADGTIWRSDATFTNYFHHSFQSQPPPEFSDPRYVEMVPNTLIPARNRDFIPEENEMKKVWARGGAAEFAVTAMQAIGNLFDQIQMTRPQGRR